MSQFWIKTGVTGETWRAVFRDADAKYWNVSVFEAYVSATWTAGGYLVTMTDAAGTGEYSCTIPTGVVTAPGAICEAYRGASPATTATPEYAVALDDSRLANLDATVSSRMTTFTLPTNFAALGISAAGVANAQVKGIDANAITAASIAASALNGKGDWNIGKTGYALSAAGVAAIWDALTSGIVTVGSIGKWILDKLDVAVGSRSTYAGGDTAGTTTLLTRIPGTVQPQTGDAFARLGVNGAGLTALGDTRLAKLDVAGTLANTGNASLFMADVSGLMTTIAYTAPDNAGIGAIKVKTDQLTFTTPNVVDASGGGGTAPTVEDIATRLLLTPANKLKTNALNQVETSNPGSGGSGGTGTGNKAVDSDGSNTTTPVADVLTYRTAAGVGIDGAEVTVYVTSEYTVSGGSAVVRARTMTNALGRLSQLLMLDGGITYTVIFHKDGVYGPDSQQITVI